VPVNGGSTRTAGVVDTASPASAADDDVETVVDVHRPKPYFAISPPPLEVLNDPKQCKNLRPTAFSVVGRISAVRKMARTLVFCDLSPPVMKTTATSAEATRSSSAVEDEGNRKKPTTKPDIQRPWRCGQTGDDMAVQLIIGKTFCRRFGCDDSDDAAAVAALKRIKVGQLVLVTGHTNVRNTESLKNWIKTNTLDLVVATVQILHEDDPNAAWRPIKRQRRHEDEEVDGSEDDYDYDDDDDERSSTLWGVYHGSAVPSRQRKPSSTAYSNDPGMSYLSVNELYGDSAAETDENEDEVDEERTSTMTSTCSSPFIRVVDSMDAVQEFQ